MKEVNGNVYQFNSINRRDFLRLAGLFLAGSILTGCKDERATPVDVLDREIISDVEVLSSHQEIVSPTELLTPDLTPPAENKEIQAVLPNSAWDVDTDTMLPNGKPFKTWNPQLTFSKTYYVNGSAPNASDSNPGTKDLPFRTIGKAAEVLQPGENVLVAGGIYRERVKPKLSGLSPDQMISYQAMPGEKVILRGSTIINNTWEPSEMVENAWKINLTAEIFGGNNPLSNSNITSKQIEEMVLPENVTNDQILILPRGLIFQNGKRLTQIQPEQAATAKKGNYWVTDGGKTIHLLPINRKNPNTSQFEVTVQECIFAPENYGLGFIHVKGFIIEHAGNGFPLPQIGALSTTRGHHWLIEENTVRQVNSIGIDIGIQHWNLPQPAVKPGNHIVRRNMITDCGVSGIQGFACWNNLIEKNILKRNAFHPAENYFESGGIKTHGTTNTLIRQNQIYDTNYGPGVWIDFENDNSRIVQNIVIRSSTIFGAIFVEASSRSNMVDHNFIWETRGSSIYEHDCRGQSFCHNFIGRGSGSAVRLAGKVTNRLVHGEPINPGDHTVINNIFYRNKATIFTKGDPQKDTSNNLDKRVKASFLEKKLTLKWEVTGKTPICKTIPIISKDYLGKQRKPGNQVPGLFRKLAKRETNVNLNLIS